jgi:ferritin-like metal-binding protein YciE
MMIFSAKVEDLHARYVDNLQKALDLERQISKQRDTIADKAIDRQLAAEFKKHLKQTEGHLTRLENLLRHSAGEAA